jgi:hypothetical protein
LSSSTLKKDQKAIAARCSDTARWAKILLWRSEMSVKGHAKEAAGFVKEEMNEHGKSPDSQRKAQEGRDLRNEGRVEDGKAPKTTKPGTGHPEK